MKIVGEIVFTTVIIVAFAVPVMGADRGFYAQTNQVKGITIKAPASVGPRALQAAGSIVSAMLRRDDIASRMAGRNAALAIIPHAAFITVLPEFAHLSGRNDPNNNPYDSFKVRGSGATRRQPVTAVSEENLLRLKGDPFAAENITYHEFGHAIMNLGFSADELKAWREIYRNAKQHNLFPGAFAMTNADEYWAELSQSFFGVNNEINGAALIRQRDPAAYQFLQSIYSAGK